MTRTYTFEMLDGEKITFYPDTMQVALADEGPNHIMIGLDMEREVEGEDRRIVSRPDAVTIEAHGEFWRFDDGPKESLTSAIVRATNAMLDFFLSWDFACEGEEVRQMLAWGSMYTYDKRTMRIELGTEHDKVPSVVGTRPYFSMRRIALTADRYNEGRNFRHAVWFNNAYISAFYGSRDRKDAAWDSSLENQNLPICEGEELPVAVVKSISALMREFLQD